MTGPLIPMERATGFEPATSTLARWRATNCAKPATRGVMIFLRPADCKGHPRKVFRPPVLLARAKRRREACIRKGHPGGCPSRPGGEARIRTGGQGFAGPCLTTWPLRRMKKADQDRPSELAWSGLRGSNPRPPPWQGGALPTALSPQAQGLLYGAGPAGARGQVSIRGGIVNPYGRHGRRVTPRGAARPRERSPRSQAA